MWLDLLIEMKKESGMTLEQLAEASGVPRGTINKIFAGQTTDPKITTVRDLVHAMGHTLNDIDPKGIKTAPALSAEALKLARDYDAMDKWGRKALRSVADCEIGRSEETEEVPPLRIIPLLGQRFAAGNGEPDGDLFMEDYETDDPRAEFAIHINGDSMEPYLSDGAVALGIKREPNDGETAAVFLDGSFLVKQYCQDSEGNVYLFSLNRARSDADVTIWADTDRDLRTVGTILLPRLPLPE